MKRLIGSLVARLTAVLAICCMPVAALGGGISARSIDVIENLPVEAVTAPISLLIAGRPAVLQIVRGSEGARTVAAMASGRWARQGALVRDEEYGPWHKVSRVGRRSIDVLQLRDAAPGVSEGYLVAWQLYGAVPSEASPHLDFVQRLVPRSAVVLSDVSSSAASPGRTIVAWLPATLDEADRLLLVRAEELGLEQRRQIDQNLQGRGDERARFFKNGNTELALTLHREGAGTALVIHSMETIR